MGNWLISLIVCEVSDQKEVFLPLEHLFCSFGTMKFTKTLRSLAVTCTLEQYVDVEMLFPMVAKSAWVLKFSLDVDLFTLNKYIYSCFMCGAYIFHFSTVCSICIRLKMTKLSWRAACIADSM